MKKVIITSGYFDPIHVGHIEYLRLAKQLGDRLIVILNNDFQCALKKGKPFMKQEERLEILKSIKGVDEVILSVDKDKTVCESIKSIAKKFKGDKIIFAKGGDRFTGEIPEAKLCMELGIEMIDSLGKKIQSSSSLTNLKEIK